MPWAYYAPVPNTYKTMTHYLQNRALRPPLIHNRPSLNLGLIVVIPCYNEAFLLLTLMSLKQCMLPDCDVEVIVVINDADGEAPQVVTQNQHTFEQASQWAKDNFTTRLKFHILYEECLPKKHAGVGLARKIGMDEAVFRFERIRNKKGIIVGFDADSKCQPNYLKAIYEHFNKHPKCKAASIHYEHPLEGIHHSEEVYNAILLYELHLRYYIEAQRLIGFPFAFQTIGSSMAVRSDTYQNQGGMNKRKAGEDFYFLHKFIPLGHFHEINDTMVIPSPRISDRVPFGTGKAVGEITAASNNYQTYAPESFIDLKAFFDMVPQFRTKAIEDIPLLLTHLPQSIQSFLKEQHFLEKIEEIKQNTSAAAAFKNRFYRWFNAFLLMKFLHYSRDNFHPNVAVEKGATWLISELKLPLLEHSPRQMLLLLRAFAKER